MLTVGVDLASQPKNTAVCVLGWEPTRARVRTILCPANDEQILAACRDADAIGIDAPFGWPDAFVRMLAHGEREAEPWSDKLRDELRLRVTDRVAHERTRRQPLSVAADRIALAALRARTLLARLGVTDRSGADGKVFEVWPAGFRLALGWPANKSEARADAAAELRRLQAALPWLSLDAAAEAAACNSTAGDNAVDAIVAALAARAAKVGLSPGPSAAQAEVAAREGWIYLPRENVAADALLREDP